MDENENGTTTTTAAQLTPPPFAVDEPVFCPDMNNHSAYYEAVIRKSKFERGTWSFLVHYTGWNSRWDRWMDAAQIWKDTAENRARTLLQNDAQPPQQQHEGGELPQQENNSTAAEAATAAATTMSGSSGKRSRTTDSPHADHNHVRRKRLAVRNHIRPADPLALVYQDYCELPFTLKTVLVEEYERITAASRLRLVHALPAPVPVSKVLNHFAKKKSKECSSSGQKQQTQPPQSASDAPNNATTTTMTPEIVQSFVQGLTRLWEEALPTCLLYPQERPQYEALLLQQQKQQQQDSNKNNNPDGGNTTMPRMVDCYGCEYLLRLFVRLPLLLQQQQTTAATTAAAAGGASNCWSSPPTVIGPLLTDLLVLMQKNRQALFPVTIGGGSSSDSNNNNSASTNYRPPAVHELLDWEQPAGSSSPKKQPRGHAPLSPMDTR